MEKERHKERLRFAQDWGKAYGGGLASLGGVLEEEEEEAAYLTFPSLSAIPFIRHGFSTRLGGVSPGGLGSMNLSYQRGDETWRVNENYHRICGAIGVNTADLVFSDQVHGTMIHEASEADKQGGRLEEKKLSGIDGMITNVPGVVLAASYADCVPLFFVDGRNRAIGLSHSGWKGTVGKIGKKTAEAMREAYHTSPEDLHAFIGPSICRGCYEVSRDVAEEFKKSLGEDGAGQVLEEKGEGKFLLDLWLANMLILEEAGIPREHIGVSLICTCCNHKILHSHRASGGNRGNLSAFLTIL